MPHVTRYLDCFSVGYSTATSNAVEVDTQGFEGVLFIGVNASSAGRILSMALKAGATTTGFVTCASTFTNASTASNNAPVITDVYKPAKRYLGATLTSSAQTPSYLFAFPYNSRTMIGNFTASGTNLGTANGGVLRCISPSSAT